jgi:hypothetical protein
MAPAVVVSDGEDARWGRLRDLSRKGIGLVLCGPPRGMALGVSLRCGGDTLDVDRSVRVIYALPQEDGTYEVGCAFNQPLSDAELDMVALAINERGW